MWRCSIGLVMIVAGAALGAQPFPPGFVLTDYADVCAVATIDVAPDGVLYAGNAGCGIGPGDPDWIRRVGVGGAPIENFGEAKVPDPDAVMVDHTGAISGTPGSILVGSLLGNGIGRISAILPDEEIVDLFGPLDVPENPLQIVWDPSGRALLIDFTDSGVHEITRDGPSLLIAGPGEGARRGIAVGPNGNIYVSTNAGTIEVYGRDGSLIDDAFYEGGVALGSLLVFGPGNAFGDALYARHENGEMVAIDADGHASPFGSGINAGYAAFGPDGAMYLVYGAEGMVRRLTGCIADCNADGNLNVLDFVCFQLEWQTQSALGDCDGNGAYNILDFVCFQQAFVGGCG